LHTHASKTKQAAKYMKAFSSFVLVYNEQVDTKSDALKREYQLKQLTKNQKEKFIMQQSANVANLP
jgi:putative endonuclease